MHVQRLSRNGFGLGRYCGAAVMAAALSLGSAPAKAVVCIVPDDGTGTAQLPPACTEGYLSPSDVHQIIDGLPPGTTILLDASHNRFFPVTGAPGGSLGGEVEQFGSFLNLSMQGTGELAGFLRTMSLQPQCETHIGPRTRGDPVQSFDTDMFMMQGQLPPGDPDFDLLRITAGTGFGMPSPGHTTLTRQPGGDWAVDSFFDITYRIDFVGAPGGPLSGMSGSTTGTIRMQTGEPAGQLGPCCLPDGSCALTSATECAAARGKFHTGSTGCQGDQNGDGIDDLCGSSPCSQCVGGPHWIDQGPCPPVDPDQDTFPSGALVGIDLDGDCIADTSVVLGGPATVLKHGPLDDSTQYPGLRPVDLHNDVIDTEMVQMSLTGGGVTLVAGAGLGANPLSASWGAVAELPGDPTQADSFFDIFTEITGGGLGGPAYNQTPIRVQTVVPCLPAKGSYIHVMGCTPLWDTPVAGAGTRVANLVAARHFTFPDCCLGTACVPNVSVNQCKAQGGTPVPSCLGDNDVPPNGIDDACEVDECGPTTDGSACNPVTCPIATEKCQRQCVNYDPATGVTRTTVCDCVGLDDCHVAVAAAGPAGAAAAADGGSVALAGACIVTDNGSGTVTLPPAGCEYLSPDDVHEIVNGLPAGTTIELGAIHKDFICNRGPDGGGVCSFPTLVDCEESDGSGGEKECADSNVGLTLNGSCPGTLCGYNRVMTVPVSFETHVGPRTPGDPVQSFDTDMFRLFGQVIGDPDFDLLRIVGGTDFGLPSPGHTTLTRLGPPGSSYAVDSFFDITYRIDFVGAPGGPLAGMSGSTTATIRMQTGAPTCAGTCPAGQICEETRTPQADGTVDICCRCVAPPTGACCLPNGTCVVTTQAVCDGNRGKFHGAGSACLGDADGDGIDDLCGSTPCGQCPAGQHWIDLDPCPPTSPDQDTFQSGALVGIDLDGDCISDTNVVLGGPATVRKVGPLDDSGQYPGTRPVDGHNDVVDTEIIGMSLAGGGVTLTAGAGLGANPLTATLGTVAEQPGDSTLADSFFDVFAEVTGGGLGGPAYNQTPIRVQTTVSCLPPKGTYIHVMGCTPLWDTPVVGAGTRVANLVAARHFTFPDCCLNGQCQPNVPVDRCKTQGGTPVPQCLGDADGNGADDACEVNECGPTADGSACNPVTCPTAAEKCQRQCVNYDPATGATITTACDCVGPNECHVAVAAAGPAPAGSVAAAGACVVADNGSGSVTLPPAGCDYLSPDEVHEIVDGLPPDTVIELAPIHKDFICHEGGATQGVCSFLPPPGFCDQPGGTLGGRRECADSMLELNVSVRCTGAPNPVCALNNRAIPIPVSFETHVGPRTAGDPVQSFDTDMFRLFGQITGDPDFDLLRVTGGTDFGLPSPGHTTLTRLGPPGSSFAVDSFFDIVYRIDFVGAPGGPLGGMSGSTTATIRMQTGAPSCTGTCPPGQICEETRTQRADGTIDICCRCVTPPPVCEPEADGSACKPNTCPAPQICQPKLIEIVGVCQGTTLSCQSDADCPTPGQCVRSSVVVQCDCIDPEACHVEFEPVAQVPVCTGTCPTGQTCELFGKDVTGDGTYDQFFCDCVTPPACKPNATGTACEQFICPGPVPPVDRCQPKCGIYNPLTGQTMLTECDCLGPTQCHLVFGTGLPTGPAAAEEGAIAEAAGAGACVVPDNTTGTVTLPPAGCEYLSPEEVHEIIDGLPAGTTIELGAIHKDFICNRQPGATGVCSFIPGVDCDEPDGAGGEKECADSQLQLTLKGKCTGAPNAVCSMARALSLPISFEVHSGPRTPGDPVQSFDTDMFRLFGQITGDPDFDLLRITGGTDFGLPSPGHTTLTRLGAPGSSFAVDSFFDIEYRIDFVGAPGGPLGGMSGSTTGTIRMQTGAPSCKGQCPPNTRCVENRTQNADGTYTVCCDCQPVCTSSLTPRADTILDGSGGLVTSVKNRFLSFGISEPGMKAVRVKIVSLWGPFAVLNGLTYWVNNPITSSELPGKSFSDPVGSEATFQSATLTNAPVFRDWSTTGIVHVYDERIIPSRKRGTQPLEPAMYDIQVIDESCDPADEASYSAPLSITNPRWGDVASLVAGEFRAPDGSVDVTSDVLGVLAKFGNSAGAPIKARAELVGSGPTGPVPGLTGKIEIGDVLATLSAFAGGQYPFPPPGP